MNDITGFDEQMGGFFDRIKKLNSMPKLKKAMAVKQMQQKAMLKNKSNNVATKQMIIKLLNTL
jgi:hypothetical protein